MIIFSHIFHSIQVSKLLILTGTRKPQFLNYQARKIEVVDLQNPLNSCSLPEEFPVGLMRAVGGFTKDGPLLCGGYNIDTDSESNACFILNNGKFSETDVSLQKGRDRATAVVLPNGKLWIQGGAQLKSSEIVSLQGSEYGMELAKPVNGHCSMLINSTTALITGGNNGGIHKVTAETYFVDIDNWISSKGPDMTRGRRSHGCAVFWYNNHTYALVAGGMFASSTEILDLDSPILEWTKGKLPKSAPGK